MPKIVRIISRLNIGGPAIHTILLSKALNRDGYIDVLVCGNVGDSEGDMMYLARSNGLVPVLVPELGREISLAGDIKSFFRILSIIKKEKPDIVHTHTAKAGTLGRIAALMSGVPVIIHTFHGHVFDGYFGPMKKRLFLLIERALALFTNKVIVVSEVVFRDIVYKYKITRPDKSVVIPLGLDLDKFLNCERLKGAFRKRLGIDDDCFLIGIVGRLVPIKNHRMFLDAAKKVLEKGAKKNIKFLIIGDGELNKPLRELARSMAIDSYIIFTGWVKSLDEIYADLDLVVLTSLNEGTPVSLIEALASAKPVIATDVGGVRDIVKDAENGLLAETDNADDFSDKIISILDDDKKRAEFGRSGREYVRKRFTKDRLVGDIKKLYEDCLNVRKRDFNKINGRLD